MLISTCQADNYDVSKNQTVRIVIASDREHFEASPLSRGQPANIFQGTLSFVQAQRAPPLKNAHDPCQREKNRLKLLLETVIMGIIIAVPLKLTRTVLFLMY